MSCESKGTNKARINQFNKIRLLNDIANQIAYFGVQCGNEKLMDYIDLNCGGIPDGEFEQVVDLDSPHQFLQMYMQTAEKRFAFAVTSLLKMNSGYMPALEEFCTRVGREMQIPQVKNLQEAFDVVNSFYLDGMPCDDSKKITNCSEISLTWETQEDSHKSAWDKAEGDIYVYYHLLECFVNGLLQASNITLTVTDAKSFTLSINSNN